MKCQNSCLQQSDRSLLLSKLKFRASNMCVTVCLACGPESSQDNSEKGRIGSSCSHTKAALQPLTARRIPT